jgi:hypothetical protein
MESPPPKWNSAITGRELQYYDLIDTFPLAGSGMLGALANSYLDPRTFSSPPLAGREDEGEGWSVAPVTLTLSLSWGRGS